MEILLPIIAIGGMGLIFGALLAVAAKIFAVEKDERVPLIEECPLSLECRVFDCIELGTHHMFLADIVAVDVDEELLDREGRLHLERAGLCAFAHGEYFELGKSLGKFGFSVKKKKKKKKTKKPQK